MSTYRGTKNLWQGNPHPEDDIELMTSVCAVVGWQEAEKLRHRRALRALGKRGWRTWMPKGPAGNIPISWRDDVYGLVARMTPQLIHPRPRGDQGPARYVNAVILKHRDSGRIEAHQNTHLIHQAFSSHPERRPLWDKGEAKVEALVRRQTRRWATVIGGGDVNRDHWAPGNARGHWGESPTLDHAMFYDVLWTRGTVTGLTHVRPGGNSDHAGLYMPLVEPLRGIAR